MIRHKNRHKKRLMISTTHFFCQENIDDSLKNRLKNRLVEISLNIETL